MGKHLVKATVKIDGKKFGRSGQGVLALMEEGERVSYIAAGLLKPKNLANKLIKHALSGEEGSDIVRDLVTQIMIQGCQERDLVDNASFVLETARMIREVLGEDGEE